MEAGARQQLEALRREHEGELEALRQAYEEKLREAWGARGAAPPPPPRPERKLPGLAEGLSRRNQELARENERLRQEVERLVEGARLAQEGARLARERLAAERAAGEQLRGGAAAAARQLQAAAALLAGASRAELPDQAAGRRRAPPEEQRCRGEGALPRAPEQATRRGAETLRCAPERPQQPCPELGTAGGAEGRDGRGEVPRRDGKRPTRDGGRRDEGEQHIRQDGSRRGEGKRPGKRARGHEEGPDATAGQAASADGQRAGSLGPAPKKFRGPRELARPHTQRPALGLAAAAMMQRLRRRALKRARQRQRQGFASVTTEAGPPQQQGSAPEQAPAAVAQDRAAEGPGEQERQVRSWRMFTETARTCACAHAVRGRFIMNPEPCQVFTAEQF